VRNRRLRRHVEDLLGGHRPRPFPADDAEAAELRTAIDLSALRGEDPSPEFVARLHDRIATELAGEETPVSPGPARRRVLQVGSAAAAAGVAAGAVLDHIVAGAAATVAADPVLVPTDGTWRTVATAADLPEGAVRPVQAGAVTAFVHRTGGQLRAVSGVCTHQGCRLLLAEQPRELTCPCHDAAFALDGELVRHQLKTPPAALPQVQVRETGGEVQIFVS
jgi:cytochrome b6-f complex iron-sulfur subunit